MTSWFALLLPLSLIVLFVFIIDYYIEAVASNHLQPTKTAEYGAYAIFGGALLLALTWNHPYTARLTSMNKFQDIITEDHVLSWGVVFSLGAFVLGKIISKSFLILSLIKVWIEDTKLLFLIFISENSSFDSTRIYNSIKIKFVNLFLLDNFVQVFATI